jgi:hypothetical protein
LSFFFLSSSSLVFKGAKGTRKEEHEILHTLLQEHIDEDHHIQDKLFGLFPDIAHHMPGR